MGQGGYSGHVARRDPSSLLWKECLRRNHNSSLGSREVLALQHV
jgi:hypothetical protein